MYEKSIRPSVLKEIINLYPTILPDYKTIIQNRSISTFIQEESNGNYLISLRLDLELDIDKEIY